MEYRGKRILVVDSTPKSAARLENYLQNAGCRVDLADTGRSALQMLGQAMEMKAPIELVIIDQTLADMGGEELGRQIKSNPELRSARMIFLVDVGLRGDAARMNTLGFDAYLTKPVTQSTLFDALQAVFQNREPKETAETGTAHDDQRPRELITRHTINANPRRKLRVIFGR